MPMIQVTNDLMVAAIDKGQVNATSSTIPKPLTVVSFLRKEEGQRRQEILGSKKSVESTWPSTEEDRQRLCGCHSDSTFVDHTILVHQNPGTVDRLSQTPTQEQETPDSHSSTQQDSSAVEQTSADSLQAVRRSLQSQGLSTDAVNIILQSWRGSTKKQYKSYHKRWMQFCAKEHCNTVSPTISQVLNFLTELYHSGLGYSALNTARSALSTFVLVDGVAVKATSPSQETIERNIQFETCFAQIWGDLGCV
ncbi:uncharacterized protein LOC124285074 [Haliotis rubra]|uniref:uncharacterized protein LOC124285074 n=1 Tax=Haliotis rubra TaxID=36100 RepID=UPI001EE51C26|nr:uncharacterized protein LOC124285074 [Haliotis rubra]